MKGKTLAFIVAYSLTATLVPVIRPVAARGHGHGVATSFYSVKGPFQCVRGEFRYDYDRYGALGKHWTGRPGPKMRNAEVDACALKPKIGSEGRPSVMFRVWFLGPMESNRPKCTFKITGGGKSAGAPAATRYYVDVIASQRVAHHDKARDLASLRSNTPWTVKFYCTSK